MYTEKRNIIESIQNHYSKATELYLIEKSCFHSEAVKSISAIVGYIPNGSSGISLDMYGWLPIIQHNNQDYRISSGDVITGLTKDQLLISRQATKNHKLASPYHLDIALLQDEQLHSLLLDITSIAVQAIYDRGYERA